MRCIPRLFALIVVIASLSLLTACEGTPGDSGGGSTSSSGSSGGGGGGGGSGGGAVTGNTPTSAESSLAQQVLTLVNQERANNSLPALSWHAGCAQVAYDHSWDMDSRDFFSHTNPDGDSPFDRMTSAGVGYSTAGENIAAGYPDAASVMNGWMNSPGHRANILSSAFTEIGIGVCQGSNGQYGTYWTQVFRAP
jgi:uncharacterized protein YkwD